MTLTRTLNFIFKFPSSHNASIIFIFSFIFHCMYLYSNKSCWRKQKPPKCFCSFICLLLYGITDYISLFFLFFSILLSSTNKDIFHCFRIYGCGKQTDLCKNMLSERNFLLFKKLSFRSHKS